MVKHCLTGLHNNTALLPLVWCCLMSFRDQSFNLEHNMTRRGLTWVHAFFRRIKNHWAKCFTLYLSANRVLERVGGGFQGKKNLSRGLGGKKNYRWSGVILRNKQESKCFTTWGMGTFGLPRKPADVRNWWAGFHNRAGEWWNSSWGRSRDRCACVWVSPCACVTVFVC